MRDELIAAIENDPDDVENYRVYADWLEANNQPRGQLMQLQLLQARLTDRGKLEHLKRRIAMYMFEHRGAFVGKLPSWRNERGDTPGCTWRYGFIHHVVMHGRATDEVPRLLELLASASGRFLVELEVYTWPAQPVVDALVANLPPTLRSLDVRGDLDLRAAWEPLARLTHLGLRCDRLELGTMDLPNLRSLSITAEHLWALENARMPKLEALTINDGRVKAEITKLLDTLDAPAVVKLELGDCSCLDTLVRDLLSTRIGGQLVDVDLSKSRLSDASARRWAEHPPAKRLARLNVQNSPLNKHSLAALRRIANEVIA